MTFYCTFDHKQQYLCRKDPFSNMGNNFVFVKLYIIQTNISVTAQQWNISLRYYHISLNCVEMNSWWGRGVLTWEMDVHFRGEPPRKDNFYIVFWNRKFDNTQPLKCGYFHGENNVCKMPKMVREICVQVRKPFLSEVW